MKKKGLKLLCLCLFFFGVAKSGFTQTSQSIDDLNYDLSVLGQWFTDQWAPGMSFVAGSGATMPGSRPAIILGLFGFEVGANLSTSLWLTDTSKFATAGLKILKVSDLEQLVALPMITPVVHVKIGLPMGFDVGVKYGTIPEIDLPETQGFKFNGKSTLMGAEVRYHIISSNLILPDLSLNLGYNLYNGNLGLSYKMPSTESTDLTGTYKAQVDNTVTFQTKWDEVSCMSVGGTLSKTLLFITPFIGANYELYSAKVTTILKNSGTLTTTTISNAQQTTQPILDTNVSFTNVEPPKSDIRAIIGGELDIFFLKLHVGLEYALSKKTAINMGLRLHF